MIGKAIGNYVIERTLAHGGMGAVFVARDRTLGRQAAIKFVNDDSTCDADATRRFLDEARITASLQHPNIVTIFDFGEVEGRPYYVMELLTGSDLATLMRAKGRFDVEQVGAYLDQICSGLHAAHSLGVVHRDLKPSNIFVLDGEPLRIKLMDFGVAKVVSTGDEQTNLGQIIGTPRYISPEQIMRSTGRVSPCSDIYSLGIVLFEMLTGASAFESDSLMLQLMMHVQAPVPKVRACAPEVPAGIAELIESCLAKDPAERPQSACAVAARFAEAMRPQRAMLDLGTRIHLGEQTSSTGSSQHHPKACDAEVEAHHDIESKRPAESAAHALRLDRTDRATLHQLWLLLQKSADFPAFEQGIREVGKHSDFDSAHSASELGESILEDAVLSTKLLRIVNAAYASRFGATVHSVKHAVVILGPDRVRSIALSVILFENQVGNAQSPRAADSAIDSLLRGEIAQQFAAHAQVSDAEQAMLCGMFRNFGRHLAITYLPDLYDQILALVRNEEVGLELASERILGLPFRKLGLGAAERWRLPKAVLGVMSNVPGLNGRWAREEDRMVALAEFSSELCEIITSRSMQARPLAIANLLLHYRALIAVDSDAVAELLQSVQESFERRYSSLLGLNSTMRRLFRQAIAIAQEPESETRTIDNQRIEMASQGSRGTAEKFVK